MVRKIDCPTCKGNKVVTVRNAAGVTKVRQCPDCGGQGFKVRIDSYK